MKKKNLNKLSKLNMNKKMIMLLGQEQVTGGQQLPTGPHSCTVGSSVTCPPTMWPPTSPPPHTTACTRTVTQ